MEITFGTACKTGNGSFNGGLLVPSNKLFRVDSAGLGSANAHIKHAQQKLDGHEARAGDGFQISTHHRVLSCFACPQIELLRCVPEFEA